MYSVKCRIPRLKGGFIPHTFEDVAGMQLSGTLDINLAKSVLEQHLKNKFGACRFRWVYIKKVRHYA